MITQAYLGEDVIEGGDVCNDGFFVWLGDIDVFWVEQGSDSELLLGSIEGVCQSLSVRHLRDFREINDLRP